MAAKRPKWTTADYKAAVSGASGVYSLRQVATGFDAKAGYDLRRADEWTPAQKRRIRATVEKVKALTAQPTKLFRSRNPEHIKRAWDIIGEGISRRGFKVAFVPDPTAGAEAVDIETGEVTPAPRGKGVRLKFRKNYIDIESPYYTQREYRFRDQKALALNPKKEIERGIDSMSAYEVVALREWDIDDGEREEYEGEEWAGIRTFDTAAAAAAFAKRHEKTTGEKTRVEKRSPDTFYALHGNKNEGLVQSVTQRGREDFTRTLMRWMSQYNGKAPMPQGSKHKNDNPKHHHWKNWLKGMAGYILPRGVNQKELGAMIRNARQRLKKQKGK